jgi:rod shape-determining protein MreC
MKELLTKYKTYLVTGVLLLTAFFFYSLNLKNREHANPFEKAVMTVTAPLAVVATGVNSVIDGIWYDYINLVNVRKENEQLRNSVKILNERRLADREAVIANERLKQLLDLKLSLATPSLAASVIGEDGSAWFKTLVINRGSADGLAEGMPVVAVGGIVGRLVKVAPNSSRVLLLTDHASAIASMIQRSRARGVVKGLGGARCSMEFAVKDEDVKVGDAVMSSGIGGVFPKGLSIGEVTMVRKGEYGIFQTIELRPSVNMSRLEEVLVLVQRAQ